MNKRDIELAKQAGFETFDIELFQSIVNLADIIRADEREACVRIAKQISDKYAYGYYGNEVDTADEIAELIRARGNK
jgi:hypothetical protein